MKKRLIVFGLVLVVWLVILVYANTDEDMPSLPDIPEEGNEGVMNIPLQKGWNLLGMYILDDSLSELIENKTIKYSFIFDNVNKEYIQLAPNRESGKLGSILGPGTKPGEGDNGDYGGEGYEESECKDGCSQECGDQNTDCVNDKCVCLGGGDEGPDYGPGEPGDYDNNGGPPSSDGEGELASISPTPESEPEPEPEPEPESSGDNSGGDAGITGNAFLDYYYNLEFILW